MLAHEPDLELGGLGSPTPATVPGLLAPTSPNRATRRSRARQVPHPLAPRSERQKRLTGAHDATVRARLCQISLPVRFSLDAVAAKFKAIDQIPWHGDLRRRIDEETLELEEVWLSSRAGGSATRLVSDGVSNLRREARIITKRLNLLLEQRYRQYVGCVEAMLRGNLPSGLAAELGRNHYWEYQEIFAIKKLVLPDAIRRSSAVSSRHELDDVVRSMRRAVSELGVEGDRAMDRRERLTLSLELWNSRTLEEIGTTKSWTVGRVPEADLDRLTNEMRESATSLRADLIGRFGNDSLDRAAELDDELVPFARSMFDAVVSEATA